MRRFTLLIVAAMLAAVSIAPATALAGKPQPELTFLDMTCTYQFTNSDYTAVEATLDITWQDYYPAPAALTIRWSTTGTPGTTVNTSYALSHAERVARHVIFSDSWTGTDGNIQPTMGWATVTTRNGRTTIGSAQNVYPCTQTTGS